MQLLATCAVLGTLPLTQRAFLRALCVDSAAAGIWGTLRDVSAVRVGDLSEVLHISMENRSKMVIWHGLVSTVSNHVEQTYRDTTHVVYVARYGSTHVAFGCHAGKFFYFDVEGSTYMPHPGVLYVQFTTIEDLVNHGLLADAIKRNAHCKCGSSLCTRCSFTLHTCLLPQPVNVQAVAQTVFQGIDHVQLIAHVKNFCCGEGLEWREGPARECLPLRPPGPCHHIAWVVAKIFHPL